MEYLQDNFIAIVSLIVSLGALLYAHIRVKLISSGQSKDRIMMIVNAYTNLISESNNAVMMAESAIGTKSEFKQLDTFIRHFELVCETQAEILKRRTQIYREHRARVSRSCDKKINSHSSSYFTEWEVDLLDFTESLSNITRRFEKTKKQFFYVLEVYEPPRKFEDYDSLSDEYKIKHNEWYKEVEKKDKDMLL